MKFNSKIVFIGDYVDELLADSDCMIIFNDDIIDENLMEVSVLHTISNVNEDILIGDTLEIGSEKFIVTAVGDVAMETLTNIGHCTIKFDGKSEADLPGEIHTSIGKPKFKVGDKLMFY